jgi:hypothetical protein
MRFLPFVRLVPLSRTAVDGGSPRLAAIASPRGTGGPGRRSGNSGWPRTGTDGEAVFQEIFHVHLHVFPRTAGGGFRIDADWRMRDRGELDATAERIATGSASSHREGNSRGAVPSTSRYLGAAQDPLTRTHFVRILDP